ncbi:DMT family transporter [Pseudomonadota bacterium]|nr:DMT family transporter [Alphaproteobacteria bacterium]MDC1356836.1 DMT family transporter [Pseudomonadota bacterium]
MNLSIETKGMLIGFVGISIFSLTLPFTQMAVNEMSPFFVAFARASIAGICALILLIFTKSKFPNKIQIRRLIIIVIGVIYGFPIFTSIAMKTLPSSHSGIVLGILPLAMSLFAAIKYKEKPSSSFWMISIFGTFIVISYTFIDNNGSLMIEDLWLLFAILFAAIGYSEGGTLAKEMGSIGVISWALVISLPINLFASYLFYEINYTSISFQAIISLTYVGLFSMFIGFFFWYKGIAIGGISRVGQVQLIQPFLTIVGAYFLTNEKITTLNILFAFMVLIVIIIGRKTKIQVS